MKLQLKKEISIAFTIVMLAGFCLLLIRYFTALREIELQQKGGNHDKSIEYTVRLCVCYRHVGGSAGAGRRYLQKVRPGI
jgi:hypothetical protein